LSLSIHFHPVKHQKSEAEILSRAMIP